MQLAWLLRPQGQNIDVLIEDLRRNVDLPLLEAIRKWGPGISSTSAAELLRILDGVTGDVFKPRAHARETSSQDVSRSYRIEARQVFPIDWTIGQAIDAAEKTARRRLRAAAR